MISKKHQGVLKWTVYGRVCACLDEHLHSADATRYRIFKTPPAIKKGLHHLS